MSDTFVVFAGQSNMGGAYQTASTVSSRWTPDALIQIWNVSSQRWDQMRPGVNTGYSDQQQSWGPEVQFAIDFRAAHPGEVLRIVKSVYGGTGLARNTQQNVADWSPQSAGELFDRTAQLIATAGAAAGGITPTAVFFGQGEQDATSRTAALAYGANLANLFTAIRSGWLHNANGKIDFFRIGTSPLYAADVRAGELRVDQADPNATSFDTASYPLQSDRLHYTASGLNTVGDQFFQLYQAGVSPSVPPPAPPPVPPPAPPPVPPTTQGQVLTSPGPGSTLTGGAGNDILNASQGLDVLTGGGGADIFRFANEPWAPVRITDFTLGTDKLDLAAVLQKVGYGGSNPVADGYVTFLDDGIGGTKLLFDDDAAGPNPQWPNYIIYLEHVSAGGLTWSALTGGVIPPAPPPTTPSAPPPVTSPTQGQVLTSPAPGSTLTGGAGNDILNASQGPDVLTGGGGADTFAFKALVWSAGHITDFTPKTDVIDLRTLFAAAGYAGADPLADGYLAFRQGGASNTQVYFDSDGPTGPQWPTLITTLDTVSPGQISAVDWLFH